MLEIQGELTATSARISVLENADTSMDGMNEYLEIKSNKSDKIIETYAFLDPGSTASFCTTQLMSNLNIKGRKTNIMLGTMSQEKNVTSHLVTGLEISGLDE